MGHLREQGGQGGQGHLDMVGDQMRLVMPFCCI